MRDSGRYAPRPEGKDKSDGLADSLVLDELTAPRIRPTQSRSSAAPEQTDRKLIARMQALLNDALVNVFAEAGVVTESAPDTKVMSMMPKIINPSFSWHLPMSFYHIAVEQAIHSSV